MRRCARRSRPRSARPDPAHDEPRLAASVLATPLRPPAPDERTRRAARAHALRADRRGARLSPQRLLRSRLFPPTGEDHGPRPARALSRPPRARPLPFRRIRPRLVRLSESGLGPEPSPSLSALSRARIAGGQASATGYRSRIPPRHHRRRKTPLARGGGLPGLRPQAEAGRNGAASQPAGIAGAPGSLLRR